MPGSLATRSVLQGSREHVPNFLLRDVVSIDMWFIGFRINIQANLHYDMVLGP